ncbi:ABC transporter substrate-binding protein [Xenorhabdus griffiniae]|uniref:ABC transporter substrate-binding protein n=1 Tax=Xenorhabdus griffiniae TaxID=351672 RepID=A0ABY9XFX5_9GAMM|nr:ABC transporter substrate-binding protein [Xenorhabdus griffiniae]MBD1228464.1 oligopeptide ABC transporter substrate-binding protein OppA [Xenorhabdus griffiniae]MBE8588641.1 oligopeptide ABC transporter substrate-binding protein OppA [Xenorhabdus griffiniae]WMV71835.1 ABC transporter substrate-binding protein [Xenorhabdus griffiniae]WNH01512.1 ABC transporter substrate-binding protein [Xenorhabdus griffiniae]
MKKIMTGLMNNKFPQILTCSIGILLTNITLSYAAVVPPGTQLAEKQEIVRNNGSFPASLDVHKVESNVELNIIHDFFDGLVYSDRKGHIEPRLAERWETNDHQTWRFHLRKGAKWSDGSPITAHDVVFSWRRLLDPEMGSPYGSYLGTAHVVNANDILLGKKKAEELGVKALDDFTLEVKLDKPVAYFLQMLTHPILVPVSATAVKKYGDKWTHPDVFVGSGAFKLSEWKVNENVIGIRNPHYWDDKNTVINKVTYLAITSEKSDLNRYLAGEIDMTMTIPLDSFASLKKTLSDQVHVNSMLSTYYYVFNTQKPPFNDVRVRKALSLAIDRDVIADKVLGMGQLPAFDILPPNIGGITLSPPEYASWTQAQRVEKARELLSEAGFSEKNPLKFNLLYNTRESHKKLAIAVTSMWKQNLGVQASLQNQEWKVMLDNMHQNKFDVVRYAWTADYNSPMSFLDTFLTGSSHNIPQYANNDFDQAVIKAGETNDIVYYQKAMDIFNHDIPVIPVYYYVSNRLVKPYIGGFYVTPMDYISTKDLYVIKH